MAFLGSASANLSPILFKGNNRAFAVNVIIHMDESNSMLPYAQFYIQGSFIQSLQDELLAQEIGNKITEYPNIFAYFGLRARNPSSSFSITNSQGTLNISQSFIRGESTGAATLANWTPYTSNIVSGTSGVVNICNNNGRLDGFPASQLTEDVHGNLWSIYTTPNQISTGTAGRYGSIIGSAVRRNTANIIITNSDEQDIADMIGELLTTPTGSRTINGSTGELAFRNYRVIALSSYSSDDEYDGVLFYGPSSSLPYGYVKFGGDSASYQTIAFSETPKANLISRNVSVIGSDDDGYTQLTSPFPISFIGVSYNSVYFGTNGYFTFGGGSEEFSNLTNSNVPALPAVKVFAEDRIALFLGDLTTGSSPNRTWIVRWEGKNPGQSGIRYIYEVRFYENQSYFDLFYSKNYSTGTAGVQNGVNYLTTWSPPVNLNSPYTVSQGYRITTGSTPQSYTITRSNVAPDWFKNQEQDTLTLASETRGGLYKITSVYQSGFNDNRTPFSQSLVEFLSKTI